MEQYTVDETITLVTEGCDYMDDGDSDIEEDAAFPLPQSDDEEEFVQELMLGSPSHISSPTRSHPASPVPTTTTHSTGGKCKNAPKKE